MHSTLVLEVRLALCCWTERQYTYTRTTRRHGDTQQALQVARGATEVLDSAHCGLWSVVASSGSDQTDPLIIYLLKGEMGKRGDPRAASAS